MGGKDPGRSLYPARLRLYSRTAQRPDQQAADLSLEEPWLMEIDPERSDIICGDSCLCIKYSSSFLVLDGLPGIIDCAEILPARRAIVDIPISASYNEFA